METKDIEIAEQLLKAFKLYYLEHKQPNQLGLGIPEKELEMPTKILVRKGLIIKTKDGYGRFDCYQITDDGLEVIR